jgi:hypothetical protein
MEPCPEKRFGTSSTQDIKDHAFFKSKLVANTKDFSFSEIKNMTPPFIPDLKNLEDVGNFYKEKIEWKQEEIIAPTLRPRNSQLFNSDRNQKAMKELSKKDNEINFLRGDILHNENERTSK